MDFNINPGEMHSSIFKLWAISPMLDTSRIGQNAWRRESFRPPRNLAFSRMKHVLLSTYPGIRQTMCQSCWLCQFQFWGNKYPLQNPRWQVPIKLGESCQALCARKNWFPVLERTKRKLWQCHAMSFFEIPSLYHDLVVARIRNLHPRDCIHRCIVLGWCQQIDPFGWSESFGHP